MWPLRNRASARGAGKKNRRRGTAALDTSGRLYIFTCRPESGYDRIIAMHGVSDSWWCGMSSVGNGAKNNREDETQVLRIISAFIFPILLLFSACGDVTLINNDSCACPAQGDWNGDGMINPLDVMWVDYFVHGQVDSATCDPLCPAVNRGDWNCDGTVDGNDLDLIIGYVYKQSSLHPCDPCDCDPYPEGCSTGG
jgi:hypothetical protein